ncbi:polysaccharide biosynthesis protein [Lactobacillus sp. DCY120]|uniref:Polysaccharide biosynthesis protein n=1 Tax=Bombilactobacillus apium TaxID=2675299 RepID=A0A850R2S2_9LACO|nr:polysaccharide biosynthesis protein [Bombilactobacillus apium]NVY96311.1 polysaccharide biosynthesis protein [Bombilactobacillus apium]
MKSRQKFYHGTWILTGASLVVKILSAIYRVPLQNIVGDHGYFVYQQVYPFYGLCSAVALVGLPMFVSQIIAEDPTHRQANFIRLQQLAAGLGFLGALSLWFLAPSLARMMGDFRLTPLVQVLAGFYLVAPVLAVGRGNFQGQLQMAPSAVSQVVEQLIRVGVILLAAFFFQKENWNWYQMGLGAHSGALFGAVGALIILFCWPHQANLTPLVNSSAWPVKTLIQRFWTSGFLLSLYGCLLVLFQLVDSVTVFKLLCQAAWTNPAVLKGIFDRGQPLAQLVLVVAVSFGTAVLPELVVLKNSARQELAAAVIHISLFLATAAALGLAALMPAINTLLFRTATASGPLSLYVLAVIFITLATIMNTIMNAEQQKQNWAPLLIALLVKIGANYLLIPSYGLWGVSGATFLASLVLAALIYRRAKLKLKQVLRLPSFLLRLSLVGASLFFGEVAFQFLGLQLGPLTRVLALGEVFLGVLGGVFLVLFLSWRWHLLTAAEWELIPIGSWLLGKMKEEQNALR